MEIIQNRSDRFLRLRDVIETTTLCRSSIYNLIKAGEFPSNYAIMGQRKAWLESEVQAWVLAESVLLIRGVQIRGHCQSIAGSRWLL